MWTTDQIAKFDPATSKWTIFDLPIRGHRGCASPRCSSRMDKRKEVVIALPRASKVAVMTVRSESDLAALKAQARP